MARINITREHLLSDDDREWSKRYQGVADVVSPEERAAALARALNGVDDRNDTWVFGYGSLMWNPAIDTQAREVGSIFGFHRAFCLRSHIGRGTPECPGLMLGLDRGGSCRGVAFKLPPAQLETEFDLLFRREMLTRIYKPTWVRVHLRDRKVRALTFVVDRNNERYATGLSVAKQIEMLAIASGQLGPSHEYLFDTVSQLQLLGINDRAMRRLATRVRRYMDEKLTGRG